MEQAALLRAEGGPGRIYLVTILDVSRSGLRVSCPAGLPSGTVVHVRYENLEIPGDVRYSREVEAGAFHLGIQVAPGRESELLRRLKITT